MNIAVLMIKLRAILLFKKNHINQIKPHKYKIVYKNIKQHNFQRNRLFECYMPG